MCGKFPWTKFINWVFLDAALPPPWNPPPAHRLYFTECICQLISESQIPHKIVNFLFCFYLSKHRVDDFVELNFLNSSINTLGQRGPSGLDRLQAWSLAISRLAEILALPEWPWARPKFAPPRNFTCWRKGGVGKIWRLIFGWGANFGCDQFHSGIARVRQPGNRKLEIVDLIASSMYHKYVSGGSPIRFSNQDYYTPSLKRDNCDRHVTGKSRCVINFISKNGFEIPDHIFWWILDAMRFDPTLRAGGLISHNVLFQKSRKSPPPTSSTYCLLLLIGNFCPDKRIWCPSLTILIGFKQSQTTCNCTRSSDNK